MIATVDLHALRVIRRAHGIVRSPWRCISQLAWGLLANSLAFAALAFVLVAKIDPTAPDAIQNMAPASVLMAIAGVFAVSSMVAALRHLKPEVPRQ